MTRAFTNAPVDAELVVALIDAARRAPAAGNTAPAEFLVLEGEEVAAYWDLTLPATRRANFPWPSLLAAPVLVVPFVDPAAYVARYGEPDKAATGLGESSAAWQVPYWWVDGGMAAMTILLGAEDAGLGALFFGLFDHEEAVKEAHGVPGHLRAVGAIALGHPAPNQRPSKSAERGRPSLDEVLHRGRW